MPRNFRTVIVGVVVVLAACDVHAGSPDTGPLARPATVTATPTACRVTLAGDERDPLPEDLVARSGTTRWYGRGSLWAAVPGLDWFGSMDATTGRIWMKIGWWRLGPGELAIAARRLDGAGTATADVPDGYGETGLQATGLGFSSPGCWLVTGRLNDDVVTFIVEAKAEG
jgi:hypothetical protein